LPVRFLKNEATAVLLKMQVVVLQPSSYPPWQSEHLHVKWKVCLESFRYPFSNPQPMFV